MSDLKAAERIKEVTVSGYIHDIFRVYKVVVPDVIRSILVAYYMLSDRWSLISDNAFRRNTRILSLKEDTLVEAYYHAFGYRVVYVGEYYIWRIKVLSNSWKMYLGVISDSVDVFDKSMNIRSKWSYGNKGCMLNCRDARLQTGKRFGETCGQTGDCIELILDMTSRTPSCGGTLRYVINQTDYGVAGTLNGSAYQLALVLGVATRSLTSRFAKNNICSSVFEIL